MATLDDILGNGRQLDPSTGKPVKESKEGTFINSGSQPIVPQLRVKENVSGKIPSVKIPAIQPPAVSSSGTSTPQQPSSETSNTVSGGGGGYEELFKKLNPYTPPTAEELEKEKKRQKRNEIFAAIGDGVMALSNLYFASQGAPNMYTGRNTMSAATKVRYDKLIKDREEKNTAYFNGLMRARQADDAAMDKERSWMRQLGLDQEARDRYNEGIAHRNEREEIADERYNAEQEHKKERAAKADDQWEQTFAENRRRSDRDYTLRQKAQSDNKDLQEKRIKAMGARAVRGKQLGFADGNGNQVAIYENVWKGSMQQVYDAMLQDLAPADEAERKRWERQMKKLDTPQKKEDYVKQNWHKSAKASQIMLTLSGIDPATMTSEVSDEDYSQYEQGGEEDFSQYEVK